MADLLAAVETLVTQKVHFEKECQNLRDMETKLRVALIEAKIQNDVLREVIRRVEELAFTIPAPNPYTPQFVSLCLTARLEK